jgi:hypothetical protein
MNDKRTFTRVILSSMFVLLLLTTFACLEWISNLPEDISDIKYVGAIGVPTSLILGLAKIFEQMYNRYMEKGVQISTGKIPELKIESKITQES